MSANRAARRRAMRENPLKPEQNIVLQNPMAEHFAAFAFGNSTICQRVPQHGEGEECDKGCSIVCEKDSAKGQTLVLCGAGPSLKDTAAEWCPKGDQVWGCNSALTWLYDNGHNPTHGFTVDQTPHMLEEWANPPAVEYLIASTVHVHLTEWLIAHDRQTRFFHNYVGLKGEDVSYEGESMCYEDWLYCALYPATVRCGSGLNSVNRAIDLALYMGFDEIIVLGADCSMQMKKKPPAGAAVGSEAHKRWLTDHVVMHANGDGALASGATCVTLEAEIDGKHYITKPDMAISAIWLVRAAQAFPQVKLVGDTLPVALLHQPEEFMSRLPAMVNSAGVPLPIQFA